MVSSSAATVEQYIDELDPVRKPQIAQLRELIRNSLLEGYTEAMEWGMICYQVPLEVSGPTYNNKPLPVAAIASQKQYISTYFMSIYASEQLTREFNERWARNGKKLNMGKSCVRFRNIGDADLETIQWACGLLDPKQFTSMYLASRANR